MSQPFHHTTVLAEEALHFLAPRPGAIYCDATLGGGGHGARILEACGPDGRLVGIDRDPQAVAAARERLAPFGERATVVLGRFGEARQILGRQGALPVDGFLLDLGISSPQVDQAARGFSFTHPGPLDMRMDPSDGETARDLLHRVTVEELARLLAEYGDERFARRIAREVKAALAEGRLETTSDLAAVVAAALPAQERRNRKTNPATKTFQALRIAVNDEVGELERFLADFPACLKPGGRIVVIAFHSLEDGMVKDRFRDLSRHPGLPADIALQMGLRPDPELELLTRKPIFPGDEEVARNPRARSARLRAAVRR